VTPLHSTAVVVRWRGGNEVDRCLRSLLRHGGPTLDRIVLVDSGSGDGGAERLAAAFPEVEVVALAVNRSFATAAMEGVARTSSPCVLLINPDAEVPPGAVDALSNELAGRPDAAGMVPLLIDQDGVPQDRWQLRRLPTPTRLALGRGGAPQFPHGPPTLQSPVEQPAAACWMLRRGVWDALGGLDAEFAPAWWEDVDFCARLSRLDHGARTTSGGFWVAPEARVVHDGGSSLASLTDADFLTAYYRNLLRYAERHHRARIGPIRAGLMLSLRVRALARPSRRSAYLAALRSLGGSPGV